MLPPGLNCTDWLGSECVGGCGGPRISWGEGGWGEPPWSWASSDWMGSNPELGGVGAAPGGLLKGMLRGGGSETLLRTLDTGCDIPNSPPGYGS